MEIFSVIASWIEAGFTKILPFDVIPEWESGVLLRFGKYKRSVGPGGFYWKVPFIDEIWSCSVSTETIPTKSQSIITADGVSVFVSGAIKCYVEDARTYLIKVKDVDNAISDLAQAEIKKTIASLTFQECKDKDIDHEISKKLRSSAKRWGIYVDAVTLTTFDRGRTIRLIQS